MDEPVHLFDQDLHQLRQLVDDWGLPRYRADQMLHWIYRHGVVDLVKMSDLSYKDQLILTRRLRLTTARTMQHQVASDGTQKLLLDWTDGDGSVPNGQLRSTQTESVVIPEPSDAGARKTACVSSQIGCAVGCHFCASGIGGLTGDLRAGQIVEQVWRLGRLEGVGRITNVVFMGMGEPLANFEQVVRAVRLLMAKWGMHIGGRRITISTVGLPAQIRRLARQRLPVTLAISLHAATDAIRRQLIPWASHVTIAQLIDAGRYFFEKTGREVTLEYIILRQVNDRPEHAKQLAQIARTLGANVNLIRYNEVKGLEFYRPSTAHVLRFQQILRTAGVNTHIRASRGRDIAAACGQLRHESHPTGSEK